MATKHEEKKGDEHKEHERHHNFIFTAKPDTVEPLKKALLEHGKVVRKQEGCLHIKIYQSKTDHTKYAGNKHYTIPHVFAQIKFNTN
jgi:quinol monooxygenase YgiN